VAYSGTHDNNTVKGWFGEIEPWQRDAVWRYIQHHVSHEDMAWQFIEMVAHSQAGLAIFPLQDLLNLGAEARMNVPGIAEGNWGWRYTPEMPVAAALERLRQTTERSGRWRS
jgi:4-alpha-glucanotransferase